MVDFKILDNDNDLQNIKNTWELDLSSKQDGLVFNERGEEVQNNYEGRKYSVLKRGHNTSGWEKFGLSLLVIVSFGTALASKYVYNGLINGRVTKKFGVPVKNEPESTKSPEKKPQEPLSSTQDSSLQKTQVVAKPSLQVDKSEKEENTQALPTNNKQHILSEVIKKEENNLPQQKVVNTKQVLAEEIKEKKQYGIELFSDYLGGRENFDKLPQLDFNTLGTREVHIGNNQYVSRPAWIGGDYPDSISVPVLQKIDGDVIRGINGLPGYEYLIVKFRDDRNNTGMFVFFCHNDTGQSGGCDIHGGGNSWSLDSKIMYLECKVDDPNNPGNEKKLTSREKYKIFFTQGSIAGTNWNRTDPVTISLASVSKQG